MVSTETDKDLSDLHTFGVPWTAQYFYNLEYTEDHLAAVVDFAQARNLDILILGEGSNMLPTKQFNGLVIKNSLMGRTVISEDDQSVVIELGAGEVWRDIVTWAVEHNYYGIENLVLIPGTVGAAPVQNIGAYGVEAGDLVDSVRAINLETMEEREFSQDECLFAYRNSIFKQERGRWCIVSVRFRLSKVFIPNLSYGKLQPLASQENLTARDVYDKVIEIRQSVLPDWHKTGTAGSFFKSPVVDQETIDRLALTHDDLVFFELESGQFKIPAGWLTERCNLDTRTRAQFIYEKHNLVFVNNFKGDKEIEKDYGKQIYQAVLATQHAVATDFGIELEPEVLIL